MHTEKSRKQTRTHTYTLAPCHTLSCCYDAAVLFSTMNRVREATRADTALLVGCFVLRECVCVHTKENGPQIDRTHLAATL